MKLIDRLILQLESLNSLEIQLLGLRPKIVQAVQNIYDQWEQEDGDENGICDTIANEIAGIIINNIEDIEVNDYGHEGDDHAAVIVSRGDETYLVDIPYSIYEAGGGYSWRKIRDVKFDVSDVQIIII